jgi:hypothetical protein
VDEIAAMFRVGRSTLYRQLHAYAEGRDCALVIYRNTRTRKVDPDTNRRSARPAPGDAVQLEADRKWFPIGATRRPHLKAIIYVVDGVVARVRGIDSRPCSPERVPSRQVSAVRPVLPTPAGRRRHSDTVRRS